MNRKVLFTLLTFTIIITTAAGCTGIQLPWSKSGAQGQQNSSGTPQTVEDKLALGILKMEDTPNAVTAEQAKKLLPLWKAVQGLSRDSKTTTEEMNGLFKQMRDLLTPEQVSAIEEMTVAQGDLQQILQKYGMQMRAPGTGQGAARTPQASSGTSQRSFQGGPGGGFQGGPGGGFPPGGFEGGQRSGNRSSSRSGAQSTPQAGTARQGFRGGLNFMLSGAVVKLLEQRAG